MSISVRVVRGPHWKWGCQDRGEGNLGTVCKEIPDVAKTVLVKWDEGSCKNYRCGSQNQYDLRIFDNSYLGITHKDMCNGCNRERIDGLKYQCSVCNCYNLCGSCYHNDIHAANHAFILFPTNTANGIKLHSRIYSKVARLLSGCTYYYNHLPLLGKDYETKNEGEQHQNLEEAIHCIGCERPSSENVIFEPCKHKIACIVCSKRYKNCVLCRLPIDKCINVNSKVLLTPEEAKLQNIENMLQDMEDLHFCGICTEDFANVLFNCGHRTCGKCSIKLTSCHMCRTIISLRLNI